MTPKPPSLTGHGYSVSITRAITAANRSKIGVKFGRMCLAREIPVAEVANVFGVSRMVVYRWFKGEVNPSPKYADKMKELLALNK